MAVIEENYERKLLQAREDMKKEVTQITSELESKFAQMEKKLIDKLEEDRQRYEDIIAMAVSDKANLSTTHKLSP